MKHYIILFLKGIAIGIANVIPGVSGGTIALVTEIYERLINALKSWNIKAFKLLFSLNFLKLKPYSDISFNDCL